MNVPPTIGYAVSSGLASYAELNTVIGVEGLHDVLEIATVDARNQRTMRDRAERERS